MLRVDWHNRTVGDMILDLRKRRSIDGLRELAYMRMVLAI